jgi:uracil-DNA glycosylase
MLRSQEFVSTLRALSFADAFNPYADKCPIHDKADAPKQRATVLQGMLEAATKREIDSIWIGRDLGYRGGRRTGLALTDDVHMAAHARRWGVSIHRATKGQAVAERTAAVIWTILEQIEVPIFLWNVFPLHPHEPGDPFSNRSHNSRERAVGEDILVELIALLRPKRIVAIGNDAAKSATRVAPNRVTEQVRHPSYGGQTEFLAQIKSQYSCRSQTLI